jgi:hypothetical protein
MSNDWPKVGFFAAGLAIGGVATATLVLGPYSPAARDKMRALPVASQATAVAFRGAECPTEPAAIIAGNKDGRYRMPAEVSGYATTEPHVFVAMGNEAAAAGRAHDAEIAYLMACRVADKFKGAGSVAAADARYELARHYGNLADTSDKNAPNCGEILRRAEQLYSDSHQLYRARYGADHEKSRQAAQGLAGVQQTLMAQAGIPAASSAGAAPILPPVVASPRPEANVPNPDNAAAPSFPAVIAKPQARPIPLEKARERSQQKKVTSRQAKPGPACAWARTKAEKLICSDAELARLDREVDYLQARARNAWKYEDEWRRREAMCRDRACMLQVISNKRSQLMADINSA